MRALFILTFAALLSLNFMPLAHAGDDKPKGKPRISANQKQSVDKNSKKVIQKLNVTIFKLHHKDKATVYAIYKMPNGHYTAKLQSFPGPPAPRGIMGRKNSLKKDDLLKKKAEKAPGKIRKEFRFPRELGEGKYADYLVVVHRGGKVIKSRSSRMSWVNNIDTLLKNISGEFDSRGEKVKPAPEK